MQSYNGTGTHNRTDSRFNNPGHHTIQDMKLLITFAIPAVLLYFAFPYVVVALQLIFFDQIVNTIIPPR